MNDKPSSGIHSSSFIVYSYIKLIRPVNLVMILFTQYMVRFAFMYPIFRYAGFSLQLEEWVFAIFSLAFVFMAAAGYIINDYYDVEIDKVNKPDKVIIGKLVKPSTAYRLYIILNIVGLIMGCYASFRVGLPSLSIIFFIYLTGLWYYSTTLKYQLIAGNLIVAVFLALVPFTAGIIELYADLKNVRFYQSNLSTRFIFYWIFGISLFAFISSLAREIVKDMEDTEGDAAQGCRTLPIVMGKEAAGRIVQFLMILMFCLLGYLEYEQWRVHDYVSLIYCACLIQLPIVYVVIKINMASTAQQFHKLSTWLKILMVSGISYLFVFAYTCLH